MVMTMQMVLMMVQTMILVDMMVATATVSGISIVKKGKEDEF